MSDHMDRRRSANSFLVAMQISDSAFPIGRYVHSSGLEGLLSAVPQTSAGLKQVIESVLLHGYGRSDAVAAAHCYRMFTAGKLDNVHRIDEILLRSKLIIPARNASVSCGRQLAKLAPRIWPDRLLSVYCDEVISSNAGNLAVVTTCLLASQGLGASQTLLSQLRGAVSDLLAAAVRLGMVSSIEAQVCLQEATPLIIQALESALVLEIDEMSVTTPELDIAMLNQQRDPLRLFAS